MSNYYIAGETELTSIADAIRTKGGTSESLVFPDGFISAISDISAGEDTSDATLSSGMQMLSGITAYARGSKYTGTIPTFDGSISGSGSAVDYTHYSGPYSITPSNVVQTFSTINKIFSQDLTVESAIVSVNLSVRSFVENGLYSIPSGYDGFGDVTVSLPTYSGNISGSGSAVSYPHYSGVYEATPSSTSQAFPTANKILSQDFIVGSAVSYPYYSGSYEATPSSVSQAFPTANKILSQDFIVGSCSGGSGGNYDNFLVAIGASVGGIYDPSIVTLPYRAFYSRSNITGIDFPNCASIGSNAFAYCSALTAASFPACTSIGRSAFQDCDELTAADFPNCTSIDNNAFQFCDGLTAPSFPACTYIGSNAFEYCKALTTVDFPNCTSMGSCAFRSCSALTSVDFPACTYIGSHAFEYCIALTTVSFPNCTYISYGAFQSCSALTTVDFPVCTHIYDYAFAYCSALTAASFPACTNLDSGTFRGCNALKSVYLLNSVVATIGSSNTFASTPITDSTYLGYYGSIYVPSSLVDAYKSASIWSSYADRITAYIE